VMLGAAYQKGLVPLSSEFIVKAIELNKVSVDMNIYSFNLGRLYIHDPANELFGFLEKPKNELNVKELEEDRLNRLNKYDSKLYDEFKNNLEKINKILETEVDVDDLHRDSIRELYRVFAIKDEYEVAKMHLSTTFKTLDDQFSSWKNISFYLAPPMLSFLRDKKTGRPRKIRFPGYIAIPLFKLLNSMSGLRGTWLDPLQFSSDKRRDLEHKKIFINSLDTISKMDGGEKKLKLSGLVNASFDVKGYGPVREKSYQEFKKIIMEK
jgi:indolepyruvate ferredoxin oxidoreductase